MGPKPPPRAGPSTAPPRSFQRANTGTAQRPAQRTAPRTAWENSRRSIQRARMSPKTGGLMSGGVRKKQLPPFKGRSLANSEQIATLARGMQLLDSEPSTVDEPKSTGGGTMKVVVRVRPMNSRETVANSRVIVVPSGPNMLIFDPPIKQDGFFFKNQRLRDVTARRHKNLTFAFDHVYNEYSTNKMIYNDVMEPLLETLLSGYNCSVFAYGATGSGKTHTMLGSADNLGLTYLTLHDLYERLEGLKENNEVRVMMHYFEVYNEQVHDLLNPTGQPLTIMEARGGVIQIKNLHSEFPDNVDQVLQLLKNGNKHRSQHPTDHNAESSRSHAILEIHLHIREKHSDLESKSATSKLVMVDLAGSEKGAATGCSGTRFREGTNINKSLLALGQVIKALAFGRKTCSYRESKLTRILKDSLGGNCKTVMIANVSPSDLMYEDTLNTLRYAQNAKNIACNPSRNKRTVTACLAEFTRVMGEMTCKLETQEKKNKEKDLLIQQLTAKMEELQRENDELRKTAEQGFISGETVQVHVVEQNMTAAASLPKAEKSIHEYQLKIVETDLMTSLHESTGDIRYDKCANKLKKKLDGLTKQLDFTISSSNEYLEKDVEPALELKTKLGNEVLIPIQEYVHLVETSYNKNQTSVENDLLRQQVDSLASQTVAREKMLKDFALIANKMFNQLDHYKHLTPDMRATYENAVSAYTSTQLKFVDNPEREVDLLYNKSDVSITAIQEYGDAILKRLNMMQLRAEANPEASSQIQTMLTAMNKFVGKCKTQGKLYPSSVYFVNPDDPNIFEKFLGVTMTIDDDFHEHNPDDITSQLLEFLPIDQDIDLDIDPILNGTFTLEGDLEEEENIDPQWENPPTVQDSIKDYLSRQKPAPCSVSNIQNTMQPCSSKSITNNSFISPKKSAPPKSGWNSGSASGKIPVPVVARGSTKSPRRTSGSLGKMPSAKRNSIPRKSPYSSASKSKYNAISKLRAGAQKSSSATFPRPVSKPFGLNKRGGH